MNALVATGSAFGGAAVLFAAGRVSAARRWIDDATTSVHGHPYRPAPPLARPAAVAMPLAVQLTALACFTFAHLFVPAGIDALLELRVDGISVPLAVAIALAVSTWGCGWLLLFRARSSSSLMRACAMATIFLHAVMVLLAAAHLLAVPDGERSLALFELAFGVAAIALASLMLFTARKESR